jgi:4-amino-4-deoxy-L-arabinose transferase-like glycosyltransferase
VARDRTVSPGTSPFAHHAPRIADRAFATADLAPRTSRLAPHTALAILLAGMLLRLLLAAVIPPVPDETYYWEWSRRLAGGYFDHPYGIALSVRGGTALFAALSLEPSPLAVRVIPVLEGLVAGLAAVGIARRTGGPAAGLRAAVVITVLPLAATGLVLATPDAPLLAATAVTLYAVVRAVQSPRRSRVSLAWWVVAGAAAGAAMASKYTGILVPVGVFVALAARPALRPRLAEPGPYVACAVAAIVLMPVLTWNAAHQWISFGFQLRHGLGGSARGTPLGRELEMIGGQAGLVSPILFALLAAAVWRALHRPTDDERFLLAVVASVCFAFFMVSALRKPVEANWPALAYVPAIPVLASTAFTDRERRWLRAGCILAAALTLIIYAHAVASILPIPARKDPVARSAGWDALARATEAARDAVAAQAAAQGRAVHVGAERYQDASELAFHMRDRPRTFSLNLAGRPNQYDLWPAFARQAAPGDALVLVVDDTEQLHPTLRRLEPHFADVRRGPVVELRARRGVVGRRRLWALVGWAGSWPARASTAG